MPIGLPFHSVHVGTLELSGIVSFHLYTDFSRWSTSNYTTSILGIATLGGHPDVVVFLLLVAAMSSMDFSTSGELWDHYLDLQLLC